MMDHLSSGTNSWLTAHLAASVIAFAHFLKQGYQARSLVDKFRRQGMVSTNAWAVRKLKV